MFSTPFSAALFQGLLFGYLPPPYDVMKILLSIVRIMYRGGSRESMSQVLLETAK